MFLYQTPTQIVHPHPPHTKEEKEIYWLIMETFFGFDERPMSEDELSKARYFIRHNIAYVPTELLSKMAALKTTAYTPQIREERPFARPNLLFAALLNAEKTAAGHYPSKEHIVFAEALIQELSDLLVYAESFHEFYKKFRQLGGQSLAFQLIADYFSYLGHGPDEPRLGSFTPDTSRFMDEAFAQAE